MAIAEGSPTAQPGRRSPLPLRPHWVASAVITITAVRMVVLLRGIGYFSDDDVNFALARGRRLSWSYLAAPSYGNFLPGPRLVDWLLTRGSTVAHGPAVVVSTLIFVGTLALLYRLLVLLAGTRWLNVVLVGFLGWSLVLTSDTVWWSQSLAYLLSSALGIAALDGLIRATRRGKHHRANLVWSLVALTLGIAFFATAVIFVFLGMAILAFYEAEGPGLRGAAATLARRWQLWLAYAVPVALYVAWTTAHPRLYHPDPAPPLSELVRYVWVTWSQGLVPSLFGMSYPSPSDPVVSGTLVLVGQELLAVVIVTSIIRGASAWRATWRVAWRAWAIFAAGFVALTVVHGLVRVGHLGSGFGTASFDLATSVILFAVCVTLAFGRRRRPSWATAADPARSGPSPKAAPSFAAPSPAALSPEATTPPPAPRRSRGTSRPEQYRWLRPLLTLVAAAGTVVYLVLVTVNTPSNPEVAAGRRAAVIESALRAQADHPGSSALRPFVWNIVVPPPLVNYAPPENLASNVLPLFMAGVHVGTGEQGWLLLPSGRFALASFKPLRPLSLAGAKLTGTWARSQPSGIPSSICLAIGTRPGSVRIRLREPLPSAPPMAGRWFVRYTVSHWALGASGRVPVPKAGQTHVRVRVVALAQGVVSSVALPVPRMTSICLSHASLGVPGIGQ